MVNKRASSEVQPSQVLYWWPRVGDLAAHILENPQGLPLPPIAVPFVELLHEWVPFPEYIVVFLEEDVRPHWNGAEEAFRQALGNIWPDPERFRLMIVPPKSGQRPYDERTQYLKAQLGRYADQYPRAHHSFLWSIGDPILEVVVLLLQRDLFPTLELVRVDWTDDAGPIVGRQMETQIPFSVMAKLRTERLDRETDELLTDVIAESPAMKGAIARARQYALHRKPVLILGESGTGKEVIAKIIHGASGMTGKFVALNCSAIPVHLLETELFGSVREASFTGATDKVGLFELADNGTVFLDEFGELQLDHQAKILRALQEKAIRRVGGQDEIKLNIQLITATNQNLRAMVEKKTFRADLYWRINVGQIHLAPLRERPEDVLALAERLAGLQTPPKRLTEAAREWLVGQPWPGNFREIQNLFDRVLVELPDRMNLEPDDLAALQDLSPFPETVPLGQPDRGPLALVPSDYWEWLRRVEVRKLTEALGAEGGDVVRTAARLGLKYNTLYRKLANLGIGGTGDLPES